jgi:ATP-binding cassette subfamily B protein
MNQHTELKTYLCILASRYKIYFCSLGILAICAAILSIFVNYQVKELIDIIAANPQKEITTTILLFIFYELMHHGMHFITRLFDMKYKPLILGEVVEDIYTKTMKNSLHWFDSHMSGEISSKISDFQDSIVTLITALYNSLGKLAVIIISIMFLLTINYKIAGVLVAFIIIYVPILFLLLKKQMELQQEYVKARQEAVGKYF